MTPIDYTASAAVFSFRHTGAKRTMTHRRFPTAAEAVQFAVESLPGSARAVLETDSDRFEGESLRQLYDAADYPLVRARELAA